MQRKHNWLGGRQKFLINYKPFFSELFNIKKAMLLKDYYNKDNEIEKTEEHGNDVLK